MIDSPAKIAPRLAALRSFTKLSQDAFAETLGITQPAWSQFESGKRRITLDVAATVVRRHGVTLDWIYFGEASGMPIRLQVLAAA